MKTVVLYIVAVLFNIVISILSGRILIHAIAHILTCDIDGFTLACLIGPILITYSVLLWLLCIIPKLRNVGFLVIAPSLLSFGLTLCAATEFNDRDHTYRNGLFLAGSNYFNRYGIRVHHAKGGYCTQMIPYHNEIAIIEYPSYSKPTELPNGYTRRDYLAALYFYDNWGFLQNRHYSSFSLYHHYNDIDYLELESGEIFEGVREYDSDQIASIILDSY